MARVRLRGRISGTRNGKHWPDPGGEVDVPEHEAVMLVRQGMARRVESPAPEPEPPNQSALKSEWVDYAVTRGLSRSEAGGMTKDELIELLDDGE